MKKYYATLCLAMFALPSLFAGTGDTTHVATHQQTHWTWWGGTDTTVLFPDDSKRYEKILMYYTLGCPASGCSEWDYTTKIEVRHDNGVDSLPQLIELARIITPYAGTYANDWKHTWTFDVTDYAPILRDSVTIRAFYGGWQNGFTVSIDFDFIEGIPPRDPLMVSNLYRSGPGGWKYGIAADPIESKLIPKDVAIPADAANTAVRFTASGHGFGNNNGGNPLNCAEFCEKDFMVKVDGVQRYSQAMWRDDCGMVALYPQGGTWLFNRANWCPGEKAIAYTHELTDFVTPGSTASLDIDLESYTYNGGAGFDPNYIIEAQVLFFDAPNFSLDAAMEEIIAPSLDGNQIRFNPVCNNPVVKIKNTGSTPLTSLDILYKIQGGPTLKYEWTGNLDFLETEVVTLTSNGWLFTQGTSDVFEAWVENPNGGADEYANNDRLTAKFETVPQYDSELFLFLSTNSAGFETTWQITNDQGQTVYQSGSLTSNTVYFDTMSFQPGCYTFTLFDSDCDGLRFFANNDGAGSARIHQVSNGQPVRVFQTDFGCQIAQRFTVGQGFTGPIPDTVTADTSGGSTGILENGLFQHVAVYPNPTTGQVFADLIFSGNQDLRFEVFNALGQSVLQEVRSNAVANRYTLDLSGQGSGVFILQISSGDALVTRRIVVE